MTTRRAREAEKKAQRKRQRIREDWARRHPDRALAERAARKRNRAARRDFGHKIHGTPETHAHAARTRQGAIARLFMAGALDADQFAASQEIAAAHRRVVADVTIATSSLMAQVDNGRRHDAVFFESLGAVRREVAYTRWRAAIPRPELVLGVIVDDVGISVAARQHGMRTARAKAMLGEALDLWSVLVGDACKEIDEATLLAAQAGIL